MLPVHRRRRQGDGDHESYIRWTKPPEPLIVSGLQHRHGVPASRVFHGMSPAAAAAAIAGCWCGKAVCQLSIKCGIYIHGYPNLPLGRLRSPALRSVWAITVVFRTLLHYARYACIWCLVSQSTYVRVSLVFRKFDEPICHPLYIRETEELPSKHQRKLTEFSMFSSTGGKMEGTV